MHRRAFGQGAKFGTVAVSAVVSPSVRLFDWHTEIFHFPVFHDSGDTDQWVENIAPRT